jgi:catalase
MVVIAVLVGAGAGAFAYTAGWLSPSRLTPARLVDALAPPGGPALGHRRNHAKGVCFTGEFISNGTGTTLSEAAVFEPGAYPVLGRFNLATPDPDAPDATVRIRGMGLQITAPNGQVWRSAMIDAPVFLVSTPQAFYAFLEASKSKNPDAMKQFITAHPESLAFLQWATTGAWTGSYAEERFNSLDSFAFTNAAGETNIVRWSLLPAAPVEPITPAALANLGPDYLENEIAERVSKAPQSWTLEVTVAAPGDPTADATKAWPADRKTISVGTLSVQQVEPEISGPCLNINFDPTVLPPGMTTSDDPLPAARSAAYAVSYNRRTAESADYPGKVAGAAP